MAVRALRIQGDGPRSTWFARGRQTHVRRHFTTDDHAFVFGASALLRPEPDGVRQSQIPPTTQVGGETTPFPTNGTIPRVDNIAGAPRPLLPTGTQAESNE